MPEFFIGSDDKQNLAKIINGALQAANFADETLDFRYDADGLGMWAERPRIECDMDRQQSNQVQISLERFEHNQTRNTASSQVPEPVPIPVPLAKGLDDQWRDAQQRFQEQEQEIRTLRAEVKRLNGDLAVAETAIERIRSYRNKACEENRKLREELIDMQYSTPRFEVVGFKHAGELAAEYQLLIEKAFLTEKNVWHINVLLPR